MEHGIYWWIGFNAFVIAMIAVDILVFHKRDHEVSIKESISWTFVWIALALVFNVLVFFWFGRQSAVEYLTGYIIEKSLSVDNLFVFIVIFKYFRVPKIYQYRVLFFGIIVAMILRAAFILVGVKLVHEFEWLIYIFGAFLVYIAVKMAMDKEDEYDPSENFVIKFFSKFMPMRPHYDNHNFFVKENGKWHVTQLFIVLMAINFVDLVFAVDSIPAIFAITLDPFIVYTSNMFAILGLRALYFALSGVMGLFHFLKYGLSVILGYVGIKMLISHYYKIPTFASLLFILAVLSGSIALSLLIKEKKR